MKIFALGLTVLSTTSATKLLQHDAYFGSGNTDCALSDNVIYKKSAATCKRSDGAVDDLCTASAAGQAICENTNGANSLACTFTAGAVIVDGDGNGVPECLDVTGGSGACVKVACVPIDIQAPPCGLLNHYGSNQLCSHMSSTTSLQISEEFNYVKTDMKLLSTKAKLCQQDRVVKERAFESARVGLENLWDVAAKGFSTEGHLYDGYLKLDLATLTGTGQKHNVTQILSSQDLTEQFIEGDQSYCDTVYQVRNDLIQEKIDNVLTPKCEKKNEYSASALRTVTQYTCTAPVATKTYNENKAACEAPLQSSDILCKSSGVVGDCSHIAAGDTCTGTAVRKAGNGDACDWTVAQNTCKDSNDAVDALCTTFATDATTCTSSDGGSTARNSELGSPCVFVENGDPATCKDSAGEVDDLCTAYAANNVLCETVAEETCVAEIGVSVEICEFGTNHATVGGVFSVGESGEFAWQLTDLEDGIVDLEDIIDYNTRLHTAKKEEFDEEKKSLNLLKSIITREITLLKSSFAQNVHGRRLRSTNKLLEHVSSYGNYLKGAHVGTLRHQLSFWENGKFITTNYADVQTTCSVADDEGTNVVVPLVKERCHVAHAEACRDQIIHRLATLENNYQQNSVSLKAFNVTHTNILTRAYTQLASLRVINSTLGEMKTVDPAVEAFQYRKHWYELGVEQHSYEIGGDIKTGSIANLLNLEDVTKVYSSILSFLCPHSNEFDNMVGNANHSHHGVARRLSDINELSSQRRHLTDDHGGIACGSGVGTGEGLCATTCNKDVSGNPSFEPTQTDRAATASSCFATEVGAGKVCTAADTGACTALNDAFNVRKDGAGGDCTFFVAQNTCKDSNDAVDALCTTFATDATTCTSSDGGSTARNSELGSPCVFVENGDPASCKDSAGEVDALCTAANHVAGTCTKLETTAVAYCEWGTDESSWTCAEVDGVAQQCCAHTNIVFAEQMGAISQQIELIRSGLETFFDTIQTQKNDTHTRKHKHKVQMLDLAKQATDLANNRTYTQAKFQKECFCPKVDSTVKWSQADADADTSGHRGTAIDSCTVYPHDDPEGCTSTASILSQATCMKCLDYEMSTMVKNGMDCPAEAVDDALPRGTMGGCERNCTALGLTQANICPEYTPSSSNTDEGIYYAWVDPTSVDNRYKGRRTVTTRTTAGNCEAISVGCSVESEQHDLDSASNFFFDSYSGIYAPASHLCQETSSVDGTTLPNALPVCKSDGAVGDCSDIVAKNDCTGTAVRKAGNGDACDWTVAQNTCKDSNDAVDALCTTFATDATTCTSSDGGSTARNSELGSPCVFVENGDPATCKDSAGDADDLCTAYTDNNVLCETVAEENCVWADGIGDFSCNKVTSEEFDDAMCNRGLDLSAGLVAADVNLVDTIGKNYVDWAASPCTICDNGDNNLFI